MALSESELRALLGRFDDGERLGLCNVSPVALGFSAVLEGARVGHDLSPLPFCERAPAVLRCLNGPADFGAPAVVERLPAPHRALIDPWMFSESWGDGDALAKRLDGYPDYAVLSPTAALQAWEAQMQHEREVDQMWGSEWDELIQERTAARESVHNWLTELDSDVVVIAHVWDNS